MEELHDQPEMIPGDRQAIRARLRRLNDLGFSVDLEVDPVGPHGAVRLRTSVTTRRYHASELERRTRIRALEGQARILLHDLAEYQAWLEFYERRAVLPEEAADRWLREVYRPTQARIAGIVGPRPGPRPGLLRRPRAQVAAVRAGRPRRRARGGDRVLPGRGRPGARAARAARRRTRDPALDGLDLDGRIARRARDPRDRRRAARGLSSALPALVVHELVERRRPPALLGAVRAAGSAG